MNPSGNDKANAFNKLVELGATDYVDKETLELHKRASDLFGEATRYENEDEDTYARFLYGTARITAERALEIADMDKKSDAENKWERYLEEYE